MGRIIALLFSLVLLSSCVQTYYVVRHGEKEVQTASMTSDVPLSEKGAARAAALKDLLKDKKIKTIYSTKTQRTQNTAKPTADYFKLSILPYGPFPDSAFINNLKSIKGNVLIVGHSNTVDDIVNGLTGHKYIPSDLPDSAYSNLFMIKKKGKKMVFEKRVF